MLAHTRVRAPIEGGSSAAQEWSGRPDAAGGLLDYLLSVDDPASNRTPQNSMDELRFARAIAKRIRNEPYSLFINDCLWKSLRFRAECRRSGINAHAVWCILGLSQARLPLIGRTTIPLCLTHCWGDVNGQRFETLRPLGHRNFMGAIPSTTRPVLTVRLPSLRAAVRTPSRT